MTELELLQTVLPELRIAGDGTMYDERLGGAAIAPFELAERLHRCQTHLCRLIEVEALAEKEAEAEVPVNPATGKPWTVLEALRARERREA